MGLLDGVYSYGDGLKRKLRGLLDDPMGTIQLGAQRMADDTNALGALADEAGLLPGSRSVLVGPQQRANALRQLAERGTEMGANMVGATVWHGSPHKFDKFDASKIGTGEGAQAYGHGLYLAENQTTAGTYAAANRGRGAATDGLLDSLPPGIQVDAMKVLNMKDGSIRDAMLRDLMQTNPKESQRLAQIAAEKAGNMYKVDLPDNAIAKMLDYDNPISEAMRKPLSDAAMKEFGSGVTGTSGEKLYREMVFNFKQAGHRNPTQAATDWLTKQGIPGMRYLDGGSRGAGQGSSNYVVFPGQENILKILERNGVPTK